jgi:hypothetical protein
MRSGPANVPNHAKRGVVRWLGRFCLERPFATFYDLQRAISAFDRLQAEPEQSERVLRSLIRRS